jgi:hypothetical protein
MEGLDGGNSDKQKVVKTLPYISLPPGRVRRDPPLVHMGVRPGRVRSNHQTNPSRQAA